LQSCRTSSFHAILRHIDLSLLPPFGWVHVINESIIQSLDTFKCDDLVFLPDG